MTIHVNQLGFSPLAAAEKSFERLKKAGWGDLFKTFAVSEEFESVFAFLQKEVTENKRFAPSLKELFRAFELCPYDKVKVVIVGTEPFNEAGIPDGLAFSGKRRNSQSTMFQECLSYGIHGKPYSEYKNMSFEHLSGQGVLMFNLSLTSSVGKTNRHLGLWSPFATFLIDMLSVRKPGLVWIFHGEVPARFSELVIQGKVLTALEPSDWSTHDICSETDKELVSKGLEPIRWGVLQNTSTTTCLSSTSSLP
jgi:uracil-DNA glycosylase